MFAPACFPRHSKQSSVPQKLNYGHSLRLGHEDGEKSTPELTRPGSEPGQGALQVLGRRCPEVRFRAATGFAWSGIWRTAFAAWFHVGKVENYWAGRRAIHQCPNRSLDLAASVQYGPAWALILWGVPTSFGKPVPCIVQHSGFLSIEASSTHGNSHADSRLCDGANCGEATENRGKEPAKL